jgi:hypothetical protein
VVENPGFWNWTFTLKDIDGKVLAEIDRDWRGFGFEVASSSSSFFFFYKTLIFTVHLVFLVHLVSLFSGSFIHFKEPVFFGLFFIH